MKNLLKIVLFQSVLLSGLLLNADPVNKKNLGFEKGDFTGWVGYHWIFRTDNASQNTSKIAGIDPRRHFIMNDVYAYDANTGGKLKQIPPGYRYSAKIGAMDKGGHHQSLSYTMKVDSSNALLVWKFAVVLQNPTSNHLKFEEPRFKITLFDEKGDTIRDCSNYDVYATDGRIGGFQTYYASGSNEPIVWRDWTTVGANLMGYYGKTITIEFMSADCTHRGHYGYGYFVLDCMPLSITVDYCTDDVNAVLSAPSGFKNFKWKNAAGIVVDSVQNLLVENPMEGAKYTCDMQSETGCNISLSAVIARYEQHAEFTTKMLDCNSNKVAFTNYSTCTAGTLSYLWDFGDGSTSEEKNPVYTFKTSGMHPVKLILFNPPSGCIDTLYREVESFSPPLVGLNGEKTYCPGKETELTAYGAFSYEWSTGDTDKNISIGAPGGKYWLLGRSSEGCVSDSIFVNISEEPDWPFFIDGDSILCQGSTNVLFARGAVNYLWYNGDTDDSVRIVSGGTYSVSGKNPRGCLKEIDLKVSEIPIPKFGFTFSNHTVDKHNRSVECKGTSSDNVYFYWDMGDGSSYQSSGFVHYYDVPSELIQYDVTVKVVNKYGCFDENSAKITVELFVPNVFTPNNDGVNDLFMPGFDLKITDRHGFELYSGMEGWNGYYKGKPADPDTYFYILNYTDAYQESFVKRGFLTLKR